MHRPIITLMTDLGLRDPYVAEMKATILSIAEEATIIDVTHQIEKFNVRMGAFVLASASQYFPKGTIHVAIVDPGVGTERPSILIQTENAFFVGPDNGVLALALKSAGRLIHVYGITNRKLMRSEVSSTFHGRDVFAPAAAHLAKGTKPVEFGPRITQIVTPEFAKVINRKNALIGQVIHIDDFGNMTTNIVRKDIKSAKPHTVLNIKLGNNRLRLKFCKTYADVRKHQPLAIIGSHGLLEISINQGNAAHTFIAKSGDKVTIDRP